MAKLYFTLFELFGCLLLLAHVSNGQSSGDVQREPLPEGSCLCSKQLQEFLNSNSLSHIQHILQSINADNNKELLKSILDKAKSRIMALGAFADRIKKFLLLVKNHFGQNGTEEITAEKLKLKIIGALDDAGLELRKKLLEGAFYTSVGLKKELIRLTLQHLKSHLGHLGHLLPFKWNGCIKSLINDSAGKWSTGGSWTIPSHSHVTTVTTNSTTGTGNEELGSTSDSSDSSSSSSDSDSDSSGSGSSDESGDSSSSSSDSNSDSSGSGSSVESGNPSTAGSSD